MQYHITNISLATSVFFAWTGLGTTRLGSGDTDRFFSRFVAKLSDRYSRAMAGSIPEYLDSH